MSWIGRLGVWVLAAGLGCAAAPPPSPSAPTATIYDEATTPRREPERGADLAASGPVPLAYRVETPSGRQAFLLGSVHIARGGDWTLHPRIEEAYHRARILVMEVDLANTTHEQMVQAMTELGALPPGQKLSELVSPETWALVQQRSLEVGLPLASVERLEPWVVALQFIGVGLLESGFESERGVELTLLAASRGGKQVRGLETVQDQLRLFDELPYALQELMLADALKPAEEAFAELDAMMRAWREGDAEALERAIFRELEENPALAPLYERIFFERNRRMSQGVEAILAQEDGVFVVVGAGHLVGEQGIPRLLEHAGFRVNQVTPAR